MEFNSTCRMSGIPAGNPPAGVAHAQDGGAGGDGGSSLGVVAAKAAMFPRASAAVRWDLGP